MERSATGEAETGPGHISGTGAPETRMSLARRIRRALPTAYDLATMGIRLFGLPRNVFGSIDVTRKCNLRCKHCYYYEGDHPEGELSIDEWVSLLEGWKRTRSRWEFPFYQCTWVGGEPLLRPEVIERCRKYFRYNIVVTNGTLPLPDWPEVDFYVSIDGDEEVHDDLRQRKGLYRRIKENVRAFAPRQVGISCCITSQNAHCIERLVEEWEPFAWNFTFDFYTPVEGRDDPLWVAWPERDRIIERLQAIRRAYPRKVRYCGPALPLMTSNNAAKVTKNCLFAKKGFAYSALGQPKDKCMMGANADCSRCGCVVPFYLHSLTHW